MILKLIRTYLIISILLCVCVSIFSLYSHIQAKSAPTENDYTLTEALQAYDEGKFRIISTKSFSIASSDGNYIYSYRDGVYRIRDGKYYPMDNAIFSPDSQYVAQTGVGLFHLESEQWVFLTDEVIIFSNDSKYFGVAGDGVYQLTDKRKVLDLSTPEMGFSPDSQFLATNEMIFRVSDMTPFIPIKNDVIHPKLPEFSDDSAYVWSISDGVYRTSDGQKIVDLGDLLIMDVWTSPDMQYLIVLGHGIYHLPDGELIKLISIETLDYFYPAPMFSPCGQHSIMDYTINRPENGVYRLSDGEKILDTGYVTFSPDCTYVFIPNDGVYQTSDMQKLFDIDLQTDIVFSNTEDYIAIYEGVYRTSDWQKVINVTSSYNYEFSPNDTYLSVDFDGVYQLSDGQKLFSIEGQVKEFTDDENYVITLGDKSGIYNINTSEFYSNLTPLDISTGIFNFPYMIVIIDETLSNQRYPIIMLDNPIITNTIPLYSQPDIKSNIVHSLQDIFYLPVVEEINGWYGVNYGSETGWIPHNYATLFYIP